VARGEGASTVCTTLTALKEAVQNYYACCCGDDKANNADVADYAADDGDVVLG